MKAIVYNKKAPDKLIYCDVDKPAPNDNEVLIKVRATSINAADYRSLRMGIIPKRKIFGADISGTIESVGKNIKDFNVGDEVIGDLSNSGFGGLAEFALAPEKALIHKPKNISFEDSAALPLAAITALQALRNKGNIKSGQKVLIVGSAGGVGTFAVQIAKYFGAEVTAVCSSKSVEQSKSLGADFVVDYTKEDFAKSKGGFDLIVAINGNRSLRSYKQMLNPNGKYVMVGGSLNQIFRSLVFGRFMSFGSKKMVSLTAKSNQNDLELIVKLVVEGKVKPVIDRRYTLDKAIEAMKYLNEGHARGKVIISLD
ncbi:MAG: alcohol dehydrogenase [Bacteroidetes bacterium HGW-Bacteroidetes-15]|nr:MAG: alcohol dehydrogenase [Bacteroidetes bacterium HGW-Bacteroidetes-15]